MPTRNYWQGYTPTVSLDGLAEFNRQKEIEKENRLIGLKHLIETQGRQIAEENIKDYLTESNDNAWVEYNYTQPKAKNKHLKTRALEGAKSHGDWAKENPTAAALETIITALPFAVAAYPIAAGLASYIPTTASALAPGSSFWMNPITKQVAASTLGGEAVNLATKVTTPYDTWGEGISDIVNQATGWNPQSTLIGGILADMINPGYLTPFGAFESGTAKAIDMGRQAVSNIQTIYNNYPIRNYNINAILKSDFYKEISKQYGKKFADDLAQKMTSKGFKEYLFGNNPRNALKAADKHLRQMHFIDDVENAGGLLGGSGQLSRFGTVKREGLMHDVDFFVPGSITDRSSPVFDALGYSTYKDPSVGNMIMFGTGFHTPRKPQIIMGGLDKGYINMPKERYGMTADMFIRPKFPSTKEEAVEMILDAKRQFARPNKDLPDLANYKPYSAENPMINLSTGEGQWNPTLFNKGIFTQEGYPYIQSIETYPGSEVRVPAMMNYKGQIKVFAEDTPAAQ